MDEGTKSVNRIEGHVFIVTYGRSGSTLLQYLLNSIDGYCIRGENNNALATLAQAWRSIGDCQHLKNMVRSGVKTVARDPWFGAENIDERSYGQALAQAFTAEIIDPPPGTRVAGFKEIRWASPPVDLPSVLDFTFRFFPNARFVFNTRDHDEVARSGWWAKQNPKEVKARLSEADAAFRSYMAQYPDRGVHVHYNDYVVDHNALKPMFDFLGEAWKTDQVTAIMRQRLDHLKETAG